MPQQPGRTMTRFLIVALASALATLAIAQSANDKSVTRLDPALDALVSPDAKVELVKGGFGFTEGPVWVQEGTTGYLLFTDIPGNVVWKLTADGQASIFASNVGYTGPEVWRWGGIQNNGFDRSDPRFEEFAMIGADGLTLDRQGRLILATFAGRSLMRIEKDGTRTVLVDRYDGKRFGGPNDVVVKSDGAIYFTDTFGAFRLRDRDPRKELDFNGSGDNYVNRYDVLPNGTLTNGKLLIDLSKQTERGVTDGMRVDTKGNLYETGPGGVWIISPEGKHLGTIRAPEQATNVGFGDADKKTLYIAARTGIYRIRVNTPGI